MRQRDTQQHNRARKTDDDAIDIHDPRLLWWKTFVARPPRRGCFDAP
jgi:hypothetical protein